MEDLLESKVDAKLAAFDNKDQGDAPKKNESEGDDEPDASEEDESTSEKGGEGGKKPG